MEGKSAHCGSTPARPLLIGNWADPTILRDGDDYYMTHSGFEYRPGPLVWHSRDLLNWEPICHAVVHQEGSIWAPDIAKHGELYYIYYPAGGQNWVVTAESPAGPWSEPRPTGSQLIDPGHIADQEGNRYLHVAGGHMRELSADGLDCVSERRKVYDGWPIPQDWAIECYCLESPKLMRRDGWYYLTGAQGGTFGPSTSHMMVSARSRSPVGPWENSPHNPIIRTWHRDEPWWSKGHGTVFEGPDGQWYCVLHGIMNGHRSLGRCTLIEPIEWTEDGWFRVADEWPDGWEGPARPRMELSDDFGADGLGLQWQFHRRYDGDRFDVGEGELLLQAEGDDAGHCHPLTCEPLHRAYLIETEVEIQGGATAGLMLFSSPDRYLGLGIGPDGVLRRVQEGCRRYGWMEEPEVGTTRLQLRIVNERQDVRFYYRDDQGPWRIMQPGMEISAWGSARAALFAYGDGRASFRRFDYRPLESYEKMTEWLDEMWRLSQKFKA